MTEENSTNPAAGLLTEDYPNQLDVFANLQDSATVTQGSKKVNLVYEFRQPTKTELKDRDAQQPYRSKSVGDEEDQVLSDLSGKSEAQLFDKLIVRTEGYGNNVVEGQTPEERFTALSAIPPSHKTDITKAILVVDSELVFDGDEDTESGTFTWSESQEYRVRTEIGSKGALVAYFTVKELSQRQLEKYHGATKFFIEKKKGSVNNKPVTKITVDLEPAVEIFDARLVRAENVVAGNELFDKNNKEHLVRLSAHVKRSVVDAVVAGTRLDLGN